MKFHWWWILVVIAAIWVTGWAVTVIVSVFFNPLDSEKYKGKNLRERILAHGIINWVFWPWALRALLDRRKFQRDMATGKKPKWLVFAEGEEECRSWTLSDGTEFRVSVHASFSSDPVNIYADYADKTLTGDIACRVRMIAPTPQPRTDWTRMVFKPENDEPDPDDEDEDAGVLPGRYEVSLRLPRGKYMGEFQVPNRSGEIEECSAVTLIVADSEDYD